MFNFYFNHMNLEKQTIAKVNKALIKFYGIPPRPHNPPDPVDMLIGTILSQNTNDKNSYKAFLNLKEKFNTWEEASKESRQRIENLIKVAGLGKQKSAAIKNFLVTIKKKQGKISLEYLVQLNDEEILKELTGFLGVGTKTAMCVLLFALRRNVCPVDTHVHRTVNRIGIVSAKTPDKTALLLNSNMPEGTAHQFHANLIRLGREICKPAKPNCTICPLVKMCGHPDKYFSRDKAYKINNFMLLDSIK
jgi:endonuclease III